MNAAGVAAGPLGHTVGRITFVSPVTPRAAFGFVVVGAAHDCATDAMEYQRARTVRHEPMVAHA